VESEESASERGIQPICEVLATATANSAYHGTRLDVAHISETMEQLITGAERKWGIDRSQIAPETVFISHETYTPARGGSAQAEIFALRSVFGDLADKIVIANTKGYTGHPMGVGIEDVLAIKALETGLVPPVANFKEVDPELGELNLSRGGSYPVRYALRLAAGFGSQISMVLLRWVPAPGGQRPEIDQLGYDYRRVEPERWRQWLDWASGHPGAEVEVEHRTLRIRDEGPPSQVLPRPVANQEHPAAPPADFSRPAQVPSEQEPTAAAGQDPSEPSPQPIRPSTASVAPPPTPFGGLDPIQKRVLEIVAATTGYPEEMLDLDLDMEADLGIDTVKQAEMFAAIREEWDIPRDDTLQLRDYPTLARAIQFVFDRRPDLAPGATADASASAPETPVPGTEEEHTREIPTAATSVHRRVPAVMLLPALDLCKRTGVRLQKGSRVVVMADRGGVGKALEQRLERLGAEVLLLEANLDAEEVVPRLEEWKRDGEVQGMYWLPALDASGDASSSVPEEWQAGLTRRVKLLFQVAKELYDSLDRADSFLVAGTRLGGRHGYDEAGAWAPLGGGVSGFTKALKRERPASLIKVVDFEPSRATAAPADRLIEETLRDPGSVEVGYFGAERWGVGLREEALEEAAEPVEMGAESVFVVTGAAGSIVSAIVADLAQGSQGIFHLLDLAPPPDPEEEDLQRFRSDPESLRMELFERMKAEGERATPAKVERQLSVLERSRSALEAIESVQAVGGQAHYHSVDLLDAEAVTRVVDEVRERHGRIDFLIHAAGLEISHALSDKSAEEFDLVFDVKSQGWFHLLEAAAEMPLGATVVFSSIAGRFGNAGQTDYSAANDLLCKLTSNLRRSRPQTRGVAIDWTAWAGIGMASRGSIPKMMELAGIGMLSPESALPIVRQELTAGTRGEVVIAESLGLLLEDWDPEGGLDSEAIRSRQRGPMIAGFESRQTPRGLVAEGLLSPTEQPFLDDHRIEGTAVLPGVMGIEAFAEVAGLLVPDRQVTRLEEVEFLSPFKFYRDEPRAVEVSAFLGLEGEEVVAACRLLGRRQLALQAEEQETVHFVGRAWMGDPSPAAASIQAPEAPQEVLRGADIYRVYFHGPAYQVLDLAWRQESSLIGRLSEELPPNHLPKERALQMAPRLIELCFQTAGLWEISQSGRLGLPWKVASVSVHRSEDAARGRIFAVVQPASDGGFDAQVIDEAGNLLVDLSGYRTVESATEVEPEALAKLRSFLG